MQGTSSSTGDVNVSIGPVEKVEDRVSVHPPHGLTHTVRLANHGRSWPRRTLVSEYRRCTGVTCFSDSDLLNPDVRWVDSPSGMEEPGDQTAARVVSGRPTATPQKLIGHLFIAGQTEHNHRSSRRAHVCTWQIAIAVKIH
ncbi:unnamed protein product [Pleuronectes platessa]|uniref:Uncharacterized protein n=1 Tax=Pleuronectes platessa TaxID=8262 RepID=A0A9N7Z1W3_PLEPL|nr:unnamed protein product [Pleuronectes platessa]